MWYLKYVSVKKKGFGVKHTQSDGLKKPKPPGFSLLYCSHGDGPHGQAPTTPSLSPWPVPPGSLGDTSFPHILQRSQQLHLKGSGTWNNLYLRTEMAYLLLKCLCTFYHKEICILNRLSRFKYVSVELWLFKSHNKLDFFKSYFILSSPSSTP